VGNIGVFLLTLQAGLGTAAPLAIPPGLSALCPKPKPGEIVVCADLDPPKSAYRLPLPVARDPDDPRSTSPSRERNALFDYNAGGVGSCSTAGAGGAVGCGFQRHNRWVEQRGGAHDPRGALWDAPQ
jgi:hypothetical protein